MGVGVGPADDEETGDKTPLALCNDSDAAEDQANSEARGSNSEPRDDESAHNSDAREARDKSPASDVEEARVSLEDKFDATEFPGTAIANPTDLN